MPYKLLAEIAASWQACTHDYFRMLNNLLLVLQYVNRSFIDLSGYTRDEVIGKPAMDILKTFDSKTVSWSCVVTCTVPFYINQ